MICPRPRQPFLSAEEHSRLSSFAPDIVKVFRPDAPVRPDGCNLRFGNKGSLLIRSTGTWSDFEGGTGGDGALSLIAHLRPCSLAEAIAWSREWLAQHPDRGSFSIAPDDDEADAGEQDTIARSTFIATLVENSGPISGTPGEHYLQGRGIQLAHLPPQGLEKLFWVDSCRGEEGALLVKITDEQGEVVGVALTYLTPDGRKSSNPPVRQNFRGPPDWRKRGLVRFDVGPEASTTLYLVEGTEKALALSVAGYPRAAATLGVGAIGRAHIPRDIQKVVVVRDGDRPGSEADHALHRGWVRLVAQGVRVCVTSTPPGEDADSILRNFGVDALQRLVEAASNQLGRVDPQPFLEEAARLDHAAYEHAREPIAKLLGWRVSSLDDDRKLRRMQWASSAANDPDFEPLPDEHQPWPEPVPDIRPVLDAALAELGRYVVANELVLAAAVLWTVLAHLLSRNNLGVDVAPRLAVQGVVRGVGKTTMLEAISNLVPDPIFAGSITSSSLFRIIDARRPTLLIDEADRLFNGHNQELLAIFNSGHRRSSAYVLRSVPQPDGTYVAVQFSTFAPIAFAGIDALPETQQDRSIVLRLKRALPGEVKHHLRDGSSAVLVECRRKLARWAADLEELPDPTMPKALFNRPGDNWRPLLAIARIAGGDWPRLAERAGLASLEDEDPNELIRLLASIRIVFIEKGVERITTADLLTALVEEAEGPWGEANRGKAITASWLRERLKDILPKSNEAKQARKWKEGGRSQRGYARSHFDDLWARYLPLEGGTS